MNLTEIQPNIIIHKTMATSLAMVPLMTARGQTVLPCAALGYYTEEALRVVGFDYVNCVFFLEDGSTRTHGQISFNSFLVPPPYAERSGHVAHVGRYANCDALGDCRVESFTGTGVMVRNLTRSAAMLPSEMRALPDEGVYRFSGVMVTMPGDKAYLVKHVVTTGGAMGLIDYVMERLQEVGVTVIGDASYYRQCGGSIIHVRGEVCYGTGPGAADVVCTSKESGKAHHAAMRYLNKHPWALPCSLAAVLARLGFDKELADTDLLCEPFHGSGNHLVRAGEMPRVSAVALSVPTEVLVTGVHLGHVTPHTDGKYTMVYDSGDVAEVICPTDLHDVFERLEVLVYNCTVLGQHNVRKMLPECPDVLFVDRLGSGYNVISGIYNSCVK